jgi:hypothetical protein
MGSKSGGGRKTGRNKRNGKNVRQIARTEAQMVLDAKRLKKWVGKRKEKAIETSGTSRGPGYAENLRIKKAARDAGMTITEYKATLRERAFTHAKKEMNDVLR